MRKTMMLCAGLAASLPALAEEPPAETTSTTATKKAYRATKSPNLYGGNLVDAPTIILRAGYPSSYLGVAIPVGNKLEITPKLGTNYYTFDSNEFAAGVDFRIALASYKGKATALRIGVPFIFNFVDSTPTFGFSVGAAQTWPVESWLDIDLYGDLRPAWHFHRDDLTAFEFLAMVGAAAEFKPVDQLSFALALEAGPGVRAWNDDADGIFRWGSFAAVGYTF